VPDTLLAIFKYLFLGLLYLFFLRVLRAVWVELREPTAAPAAPVTTELGGTPTRRTGPKAKAPKGVHLVLVEPPARKGQTFDLADENELTVGRAAGCGVAIPEDTFVSQLHARIFRRDGKLFVEDLGSTNGTFLNRKPVSGPVTIRKGDRLQVGKTVLEVDR
jgi:pSer/pThr/pTyr-binding forkhead associated (FHA) protein